MIEFFHNFHFLRPWVLLFFVLPIGFYFKKAIVGKLLSSWENICDKNLLQFLLVDKGSQRKISIQKYLMTGIISAILAAAGPCWKKIEMPTFVVENPSIFVLSLAKDMQLTDISPSRLERSKFIISDITDAISDGQYGLMVYSQEPYIVTPLTDDVKIIKSLLPQIVQDIVPDYGDRLDRAIDLAIKRFQTAGYSSGNIIVFTADVGQRLDFAIKNIEKARQLNYDVSIIDASFSGNEKLQMLAEKGNGIYMNIKNPSIRTIIDKLSQKNQDKLNLSQNLRSTYIDYGYYLIFITILCLFPVFRRGFLVLLFLLIFSNSAHAGFFINNNQEGLLLFNQQQYDKAIEKFKDPIWRGITFYKQEKNEEALNEFLKSNDFISLYNQGVVLTKLCKYEEALKAFNDARSLDKNDVDTLYNIQLIEDILQKSKDDPSLLDCDNKNQEQQNQQQNSQQNSENNNKNQQSNDKQQNNGSQNDNSDNTGQNQNNNEEQEQNKENGEKGQNSSEQSEKNNNNEKQNTEQNSQSQNDNQQQTDRDAPSDKKANEKEDEKNNTQVDADNDTGKESISKNNQGDGSQGSEEQEEDVESQIMNAKKGDDNDQYDEEALAIQRQYREIPEDVGGLLREFIKKEYMKDRYQDENK